jgi:hypothetical protein
VAKVVRLIDRLRSAPQPEQLHLFGAPRLITLEAWVLATYGKALSIATARRWVRDGFIYPVPEKHGRAYYLDPGARYVDPANPPADLKPSGAATPFRAKA